MVETKITKHGIVKVVNDGSQNENLFLLSGFDDISTFGSPLASGARPLGYYNGNANLHTFINGEDTVSLTSGGNIGICFVRLASEINLDSSSNYTISCWSKTTKPNAHLDIGLSYYNQSDSGVWRGGTGAQNYNAIDTWQYFTRTFKPDADTKAICYCFTVVGDTSATYTFTIKQCKLEKGSIATPWLPSPEDNIYLTHNYSGASTNSGFIEYDNTARIYKKRIDANQFYEI